MKRGHRRTHSANFLNHVAEQTGYVVRSNEKVGVRSGIPNLLNKCQVNINQKICNVESLNAHIKGQQDKMFNFGKGLSKPRQQQRDKLMNEQFLVAIPQKLKRTVNRMKKSSEIQLGANKIKQSYNSILKISNRQIDKSKVVNDAINKIIKLKISMLGEKKQRKLSLHDTELKSMSKQMRHKKDVSNFK